MDIKMNNKKETIYSIIILTISLIFYLFFAFYDGAVICVDTPSYIEMSITREFLYPAFLAILRGIFGESYLLIAVILQSILAAVAAWNITVYCKKQFTLNNILAIFVFVLPLATSLLNRFVAGRGSMYSNSILTEGITISLFLLFFRFLFEYMITGSKRVLVVSSMITAILIATRKQMYVALILLFFAIVYVEVKHCCTKRCENRETKNGSKERQQGVEKGKSRLLYKAGKALLKGIVICVFLLAVTSFMDHTYNYIVRGRFVGHSSDSRFVLTMVMYASEEEYADELPQELQPLFLDIYEKCDSQGYLMHSAGEGWYDNVVHFGDYYDLIQINTMWPAIQEYAENFSNGDDTQRQLITDEVTGVMISHLLPKTSPKILQALWNNFLSGLVTTIAQRNHILIYYSIVAYLGYIALLGFYFSKVKKADATILFCLATLVSIVVNVGLVSAVIFCQTRYTIYNMPLFYISGLLLLNSIYRLLYGKNDTKRLE